MDLSKLKGLWDGAKGWRTVAFGALITILAGLQLADLIPVFGEQMAPIVLAAIGVIVMWLRTQTSTPAGEKK